MTPIHHSKLTIENSLEVKPLVAIVGPTAVGKSQVGILVAKALGTEVLSADSRQVYRGMDIGTDKPGPEERQGVPHRLIDLVEPDQPFNVGLYRRQALAEIERLHRAEQVPLVVGGTGLYIRALVRGLWAGPSADWNFRERLEGEAREHDPGYLHEALARVDPESAGRLHPHDHVKIIRALEVHHLLGRPLSDAHRRHASHASPCAPLLIGLIRERETLYRRIEARVEAQLAKGLIQETRQLLATGYARHLGAMKGLGYRQIAGYLAGDYDVFEAIRRLKRDTRHFAKRQLTWFRKEPEITWLSISERESPEQTAARVLEQIDRFLTNRATGPAPEPAVTRLAAAASAGE